MIFVQQIEQQTESTKFEKEIREEQEQKKKEQEEKKVKKAEFKNKANFFTEQINAQKS